MVSFNNGHFHYHGEIKHVPGLSGRSQWRGVQEPELPSPLRWWHFLLGAIGFLNIGLHLNGTPRQPVVAWLASFWIFWLLTRWLSRIFGFREESDTIRSREKTSTLLDYTPTTLSIQEILQARSRRMPPQGERE